MPQLLKERDSRFKTTPVIVSCFFCKMTMWGNSDNCYVMKHGAICCKNCLPPEEKK